MKYSEKKNALLKELYFRRDKAYYLGVRSLFNRLGIEISDGDIELLAKDLHSEGLIELVSSKTSGPQAHITGNGIEYAEEILEEINNNDTQHYEEQELKEMISKLKESINSITSDINELKLGQEIIYNDFDERFDDLFELINKVPKKNIREMILGKLIDLGLGKLIPELVNQIESKTNLLDQ